MLEIHGGTTIAQPIETVFDYIADMRNEPKWLRGADDVRLVSGEPVAGGSQFSGTYARAGQVSCTLSEYDRPHRLVMHGEAKGMSFDDAITLTPMDGGTQLSAVMRARPKGLFKLVAPMIGRVIGKQFQANWDRLRGVLESA